MNVRIPRYLISVDTFHFQLAKEIDDHDALNRRFREVVANLLEYFKLRMNGFLDSDGKDSAAKVGENIANIMLNMGGHDIEHSVHRTPGGKIIVIVAYSAKKGGPAYGQVVEITEESIYFRPHERINRLRR